MVRSGADASSKPFEVLVLPCRDPSVSSEGRGWVHEVKPRGDQAPAGLPWVTGTACSTPAHTAQLRFCHQLLASLGLVGS